MASHAFNYGDLKIFSGRAHPALAQTTSFTFSPSTPAPGQSVQFTDTSSPTPTTWAWDFGDPSSGANNTSTLQNPTHIFGAAGVYNVMLTTSTGGNVANPVTVASSTGACQPAAGTLCLNGGRFQVSANWTRSDGSNGSGTAVSLTDDSGYFWFFDPTNIELVTKVLDGCAINGNFWFFGAGLTNVGVQIFVTDLQNPQSTKLYTNDFGTAFPPMQDTSALHTCP